MRHLRCGTITAPCMTSTSIVAAPLSTRLATPSYFTSPVPGVDVVELTSDGGVCRARGEINGTSSMAGIACEEIFNPRSVKRDRAATTGDRRNAVAFAKGELGPVQKGTGAGWWGQEDPRIQRQLDLYKSTAKSIIRGNMKAVEAIAKALRRRGRLSGAQVECIISQQ